MLDLIRKKKNSFLIKIVFWTIIAAFVGTIFLVWGKGRDGQAPSSLAATVNDTRIGYAEYQRAYSSLYNLYQSVYREQFTPAMEKQLGLKQQALDTLINQALLLEEADRLGMDVSRKELVQSIAEIPAFQNNGAFNKELYLQILASQRLTPEDFETIQRRELLVEKVRQKIISQAEVSEEEITEEFSRQNEKINLSYAVFEPALFESQVKLDEEELKTFFEERREDFKIPEKISLQYLNFDPSEFEEEVALEEGALEKYYRRHLDRFEIPERVKASHILIKVSQDADEKTVEEKRALAEKVLQEAREGMDFAELARTYSEDTGTAPQGGDLGYFGIGEMVAPFENAAFALQSGQISDIVQTSFGFHIIKVEDHIEAGVKPMEDVLAQVEEGARAEAAKDIAYEKAIDAYNINRKEGSLEAAAEANGRELKETELFGRDDPVGGIGPAPEIKSAAFALEEGKLARPVILPEGVFLFTVLNRETSRLPELEEVREEVEKEYLAEKAAELARQNAEEALAALKEGKTMETAASGAKIEKTGEITRAYGDFIPRLGRSPELAEAAFSLTMENPIAPEVFLVDGKYVVAVLEEHLDADLEKLDETQREEIREALLSRQQQEALEKKLGELRSTAEISIQPIVLASLEG